MKTSAEWWAGVKNDPDRLIRWLQKQFHGEATAAARLKSFMDIFGGQASEEDLAVVKTIADQEDTHAKWIGSLLAARGRQDLVRVIEDKVEPYWNNTLPGIESWETGCAVAAHAENMRLDRIRVISEDPEAPEDILKVFSWILPQEIFHESAFRKLTTEAALEATRGNHEAGAKAIGLVP